MNFLDNKFESRDFAKSPKEDGGLRKKHIFKSNKENKNLISILTVVKDGEKYLEECILSVAKLNYKNYEHIIVDGCSSDKTIQIIKKYEDQIDYWCSKPDQGIYDGFNTALTLAKGEYVGFVNSDDLLTPDSLVILDRYIKNYPDKDFIFGSVQKHWGVLHGYRPWKIKFSWGFYSSHSTGFFIKLSSAKKLGFYNLNYKYSSDYDYFYRMIVHNKMKGIATNKEELFGIFRRGGFSSKINFFDHFCEEIKIRLNNKQNRVLILILFIYKFIKNLNRI
jgi:glycosyltransferase involved in cell wall biosynthesis